MGAYLSHCKCLDISLLSNNQATIEKVNALETQHTVLQNNFVSLESEISIVKKDMSKQLEALEKKLEAVEKKTNGMFFVQEEPDSDVIVLHKGK